MMEPNNGKILKFLKAPAEPVSDRYHIHMNQEVAEQIVSALFRVKDTQMISKQKIIQTLAIYVQAHHVLVEDLFIANCDHPRFNEFTEAQLAPMRIMRLEAISGKLPSETKEGDTKNEQPAK